MEGFILKKQKKGRVFKKYWFALLNKELYCMLFLEANYLIIEYKNRGDAKHKDMQSLVGIHIKNEQEENVDD